jgi:hypothetical protein
VGGQGEVLEDRPHVDDLSDAVLLTAGRGVVQAKVEHGG